MTPEDINIIVEAQGAETRQLVASLISNRLTEVGFTKVDVGLATREDKTSTPIDAEAMPSLLDAMKEANPAVFARPVSILAMPFSDVIDNERIVHVSLMKDRPDMLEGPELEPGQGRLEDGTIIDLATYVSPDGTRLAEALIEVGVAV
jgi:hypothetical protein